MQFIYSYDGEEDLICRDCVDDDELWEFMFKNHSLCYESAKLEKEEEKKEEEKKEEKKLSVLIPTPSCGCCWKASNHLLTTNCGHLYCYLCLSTWLGDGSKHQSCPLCRNEVITPAAGLIKKEEDESEIESEDETDSDEEDSSTLRAILGGDSFTELLRSLIWFRCCECPVFGKKRLVRKEFIRARGNNNRLGENEFYWNGCAQCFRVWCPQCSESSSVWRGNNRSNRPNSRFAGEYLSCCWDCEPSFTPDESESGFDEGDPPPPPPPPPAKKKLK
jgi:hypothetical protein